MITIQKLPHSNAFKNPYFKNDMQKDIVYLLRQT